jgi:hypothetical protein
MPEKKIKKFFFCSLGQNHITSENIVTINSPEKWCVTKGPSSLGILHYNRGKLLAAGNNRAKKRPLNKKYVFRHAYKIKFAKQNFFPNFIADLFR